MKWDYVSCLTVCFVINVFRHKCLHLEGRGKDDEVEEEEEKRWWWLGSGEWGGGRRHHLEAITDLSVPVYRLEPGCAHPDAARRVSAAAFYRLVFQDWLVLSLES